MDRRNFTAREKVSILKEHLLENKSISGVCEKHKLKPTIFYRWQKQFFENGERAFQVENVRKAKTEVWQQQVSKLEDKLTTKNEVLSELMEEHLRLKKELGEL